MRLAVVDTEKCVGCQSCMFACARRKGEAGLAQSAIGVRSIGGMEKGFIVVVCRACNEPPCAKVCPTDALIPREGGGVRLDSNKCIGCARCRETCPLSAIFWDNEINKPVICAQCGYCVEFCPHEVLELQERKEAENA